MNKKAVFGLMSSQDQAQKLVDRLLSSGFRNEDISLLAPDRKDGRKDMGKFESVEHSKHERLGKMGTEKHTKAPEGATTGAAAGGIIGGSIGLLAGIGALAIPGLGAFIAAGPIMAALGGSAIGGSVGLVVGALVGAGIPEYEAKRYEEGLKKGNVLISVHTETDKELDRAKDMMKKEGATDICSTTEKAHR